MTDLPWEGVWIGYNWQRDAWPVGEQRLAFRYDFALPNLALSAVLRISAFAGYALWINGYIVGYGPARSYPREQLYDEYHIRAALRPGDNHIAVLVMPPTGVTGYSLVERMGLIVDGEIVCPEDTVRVATNTRWYVRPADWFEPSGNLCSLPTGFQEHVRGELEPPKWKTALPLESEGWRPAWYLGPVGTPPWKTLRQRPIPLLEEVRVADVPLVWRGRASRELADVRANLARLFNEAPVEGRPVQGYDQPWITSGEENVFVFDYGKTRLIRPALQLRQVKGPVRLELYYDLALGERPTAMRGFHTPQEGFVDSYTPPQVTGEDASIYWECASVRGFRFLTVKVAGEGQCVFRLGSRTVDYRYPPVAEFTCGSTLFEQIWQTSAETLRSATNDVIVDTCSRERVLWTFDACVSAKAAFYTFGETAMWRRCLALIAQGVDEDGIPSAIVPARPSFMSLFDQTMAWVMSCWDYYLASGDLSLLQEVAAPMERFLRLCARQMTPEGLFVPPEYSWHWVDWAPIDKRPYALAVNAMLLVAAQAAQKIGDSLASEGLRSCAAEIIARLEQALPLFYDEERGCYRAHLPPRKPLLISQPLGWPGGAPGEAVTHNLHGNALLLWAGLGSEERRRSVARFIATTCDQPYGPENRFGPGWTDLILSPLFDYGFEESAISFISRVYGDFIDAGAPTWGEVFDGSRFNTAHGWGAAVNTLIAERIIGLRPLEPGWKRILLRPVTGGLPDLSYTLSTPAGQVAVKLRDTEIMVTLPKGVILEYRGEPITGTGEEQKLPW